MAFVFEIEYDAPHGYIRDFIEALAEEEGVEVSVVQSRGTITLVGSEADERLAPFLEKLARSLPASIFMKGSSHRIIERPMPKLAEEKQARLPHAVGLCTRCMKELFDPSSRRYYYPFTACNCCGAHYPFFERYPYERSNTTMRFFVPCEACERESQENPFRRDFPLIACHACGIPVRMRDSRTERYANDSESFKRLFETAAKAIQRGETVRVKTLAGWRLFFDASQVDVESEKVMLMLDAAKFERYCAVIRDEVHAVLSVERPLVRVAVSDETLFDTYGKTTPLKYPDEGFTILLARELTRQGYEHIAYLPCDAAAAADYVVDYDVHVEPQREMRFFINKSDRFVVDGERGVFPMRLRLRSERVAVAHGMAAVSEKSGVLVDRMEKLESAEASELWLLEGEEPVVEHSRTRRFSQAVASVMSVLVEHERAHESAVGVYFGEEPTFVYHDGKRPIVAVPPMAFDSAELRTKLSGLRDGSDRLLENFSAKFPEIAEKLFDEKSAKDVFDAAAVIMGIPGHGLEAVGREALRFQGKGGVQVDTKIDRNRFDPYAFIASLMSYKVAGVDSALLAFSIFESFGDYVTDIATQLKAKAKAEHIVLCGRAFGNPSLFSRVKKKFGNQEFLMNKVLPIDRENALVGALTL